MLEKCNLQGNGWLHGIFELINKWAMVYGRHMFTADMKSVLQSDMRQTTLKKYLSLNNTLLLFFEHYTLFLAEKRNQRTP